MSKKRSRPEEIVAKLRQVDVLVSQGESVAAAIRAIGVTEVTYYRWRREFSGLKSDQVRRMKELETENHPRRRLDKGEGASRREHRGGHRQPLQWPDDPPPRLRSTPLGSRIEAAFCRLGWLMP
jgi:putative transposase